jgi:hypothetical protein
MRYLPRSRGEKFPFSIKTMGKLKDAIERDAIRWDCSKNWIMVTALGAFYGIEVINPFKLEKADKKKNKQPAKIYHMRDQRKRA